MAISHFRIHGVVFVMCINVNVYDAPHIQDINDKLVRLVLTDCVGLFTVLNMCILY